MPQNAYFQLTNKEDGLYITLFPPDIGERGLTFFELNMYLTGIKAERINKDMLKAALAHQSRKVTEVKLSDAPIQPVTETLSVKMSDDKLSAVVRVYSPSNDGRTLSKTEFVEKLAAAGVKFGVIEEAIDEWMINRRYCSDFLIAEGIAAEDSTDAVIEYHFNTEHEFRPTTDEKGNIDFHQLNLLNQVDVGDVLAVLTPAYEGTPGTTVMGIKIPSKKPLRLRLKYGNKNIELSEDECVLTSTATGHVEMQLDKVVVHNVYTIKGDVGPATGDVIYDGTVRISGDVLSGYAVNATGDISVNGVVEAATLIAGGRILLAKGIHGEGKGSINAFSDVVAKFIQMSTVFSGGTVSSNSILHSKILAKNSILVDFRPGLVCGGELKAKTLISARVVGSSTSIANTTLEVGPDPSDTEDFQNLEKLLVEKRTEQRRLRLISGDVNRSTPLSSKTTDVRTQLSILDEEIDDLLTVYRQLKLEISMNSKGKITVSDVVYEGTRVVISDVSYYVHDSLATCQFMKKGPDVNIFSL